jgi:hypothetical protein
MIPDKINNNFLYNDTLWDSPFNNCVSRARQALEIIPNKDRIPFVKFFIQTDSYFLIEMRSIKVSSNLDADLFAYKEMLNRFCKLIEFDAHVLDIKAYY